MSDKKYPLSVAPLYKSGYQLQSIALTPEILETLGSLELGGKLVVKTVKDEWRKTDKSPHAYIEYLTPEEVRERKEKYGNKDSI